MATVQPSRLAPHRPPEPSPPLQAPPAPYQAPPDVAWSRQLPCKRSRAGSREERVADSCCPAELVVIDDGDSGDEDGCGSCVDGGESGGGRRGSDVEVDGSVAVWWRQESSSSRGRCFVLAGGGTTTEHQRASVMCDEEDEEDDPKVVAARRREEDRKFWEACLASGYP